MNIKLRTYSYMYENLCIQAQTLDTKTACAETLRQFVFLENQTETSNK